MLSTAKSANIGFSQVVQLLEFGRCTHRTSKIGNTGACWNIAESASASRRCRWC